MDDKFDVLISYPGGAIKSRMGPYTRSQADMIARTHTRSTTPFNRGTSVAVVPHQEAEVTKKDADALKPKAKRGRPKKKKKAEVPADDQEDHTAEQEWEQSVVEEELI
jgi:hypothetical protein